MGQGRRLTRHSVYEQRPGKVKVQGIYPCILVLPWTQYRRRGGGRGRHVARRACASSMSFSE